jgi:hypothetical protein
LWEIRRHCNGFVDTVANGVVHPDVLAIELHDAQAVRSASCRSPGER